MADSPRTSVFDCPACQARVLVDEVAREAIGREGCPVCAAAVGPPAFTPTESTLG